MEELVYKTSKGTPVTTSLKVAEVFEKEHKDVLDAIRKLLTTAENSAVLSMFYETTYLNSQNKKQPIYIMNRDGFSLLVMGFTGERALNWKVKYIQAFNAMEETIKQVSLPNFKDPIAAARAWADAEEKAIQAEAKVKALLPKASFADRVIGDDSKMVDIGQTAKLLKLPFGRNTFFKKLREDGVFFKNRNEPMQEYIDRGYFDLRQIPIETNEHGSFVVTKIYVLQRGLFWLSKKYGGSDQTGFEILKVI